MSVEGFEPSASQGLNLSGLPVAYTDMRNLFLPGCSTTNLTTVSPESQAGRTGSPLVTEARQGTFSYVNPVRLRVHRALR